MPVSAVRRSLKAQEVAVLALHEVIRDFDRARVSAVKPGRLEMIPVYSISARNIVAGKWNRGWRSGWRYFWTHEKLDLGIIVEVRRGAGNEPCLASVSIGKAARANSAELAELCTEFANDPNRYRPRILRLPWIGLEAIWLNTDSLDIPDHFLNRAGAPHGEAFRVLAVERARDFQRLRQRTHVYAAEADGASAAG